MPSGRRAARRSRWCHEAAAPHPPSRRRRARSCTAPTRRCRRCRASSPRSGSRSSEHWPDLGPARWRPTSCSSTPTWATTRSCRGRPARRRCRLIALIGSEAPGRIEWALAQRADAQLLKPVGNAGVYSALLIARQGFEARRSLAAEIDDLRGRLAERQTVVRAVALLAARGRSEDEAFALLRRLAMDGQATIEQAARRIVGAAKGGRR